MELRTFRMKLYTIIYSVCQLVSLIQLKGVEKDATITAKKLLFCFKFFYSSCNTKRNKYPRENSGKKQICNIHLQ